jgi:4-amino-4-deoxy-L-arabinose transferase-like glycosyltransferase
VSGQLLTVVAAYCALVAALALLAAAGVRCVPALRAGLVVAELLLVVQALAGAVSLLRGHRPQDPATHLGYLAVSVVLIPLLLGLPGRRRPDRRPARADHLVAAVAAGVALVVSVRLHTTWRA